MTMNDEATPHFGICIKNQGCEDLELRKLYEILLPDEVSREAGLLRVVDDSGEDYLYPAENFVLLPLLSRSRKSSQPSPRGSRRGICSGGAAQDPCARSSTRLIYSYFLFTGGRLGVAQARSESF